MKSTFYLVSMIIFGVILVISNIFNMRTSPLYSLFNLILIIGVISLALLYGERKQNERFQDAEYNYDRENPNALVSGRNIAGTVYASYPNSTPGLGWIL